MMASSHNIKKANRGDSNLSSQELSLLHKLPQANPKLFVEEPVLILPEVIKPTVNIEIEAFESKHTQGIHEQKSQRLKVKYDFDDIRIMPKVQTDITSRYEGNQIDPYYNNELGKKHFPLMTAPMDSVVNMDNAYLFQKLGINVVLPRTENIRGALTGCFNSYGFNDNQIMHYVDMNPLVLLDIANGHMSKVIKWCYDLKKKYPNCKIMAGNIANPDTFKVYADSGVIDYARVGIGNGNGCLTTQQTGIGYPMASLIMECYDIKYVTGSQLKIVADGGMKKSADIIVALALGADYVMVGSLLAKAVESSGQNYWHGIKINPDLAKSMYEKGFKIDKEFRGMSTKAAQLAMGKTKIKTSEGVVRRLNVEYTLKQWVDNFESYLRSSMSYCNANRLGNFIGKADYNIISQNAFNRFNK